ncbi:MAG TPA: hypothetical protein PLD59_13760 [Tepidisphaeraceae bacterium]|nr:hypothetical protein [Tepidisphaeraceae bacterium]
MSTLYASIRAAIADERLLISYHADERCEERSLTPWQLIGEFDSAEVIKEVPDSQPNPTILVRQRLADGTIILVVWAWLQAESKALMVTAFEPD